MGWGKRGTSISVGEPQRPKTHSRFLATSLGLSFPYYN